MAGSNLPAKSLNLKPPILNSLEGTIPAILPMRLLNVHPKSSLPKQSGDRMAGSARLRGPSRRTQGLESGL